MSARTADDDRAEFSKLAWITAVLRSAAVDSDTVRKVILHLGMTANRFGERAYKPTADLMAELGVSEATVKRARRESVKYELMAVTRKGRSGAGGNKSAEYRLLMPTAAAVTGVPSVPIWVSPDPNDECIWVSPDPNDEPNWVSPDPPEGSRQTQIPPRIGSPETPPLGTASLGSSLGDRPPNPPGVETGLLPTTQDGRGRALDRFRAMNLTGRSIEANRIAEAFSASLPAPIEHRMRGEIAAQIEHCIGSDIPAGAIADGLQAWTASDSWSPTQIPRFVHKAANRAHSAATGPRRSTSDERVAQAQALKLAYPNTAYRLEIGQ